MGPSQVQARDTLSELFQKRYGIAVDYLGQMAFVPPMGYVSARLDVPNDHAPAWRIPKPGAIKTYSEEAMEVKDKWIGVAQELFGR